MVATSKILKKKIEDVNEKVLNTNGLVKKNTYNTKLTEMENKIPKILLLLSMQKPQRSKRKYLIQKLLEFLRVQQIIKGKFRCKNERCSEKHCE